jgi:hypothetical protein
MCGMPLWQHASFEYQADALTIALSLYHYILINSVLEFQFEFQTETHFWLKNEVTGS